MIINKLKDAILSEISGLDIFRKYISSNIKTGISIRSPLRPKDKHPSFNIYKNKNNNYIFKDFAGESGDCFYFVMRKFNVDFKEALDIVAHDFNIKVNNRIDALKSKVVTNNIKVLERNVRCEFDYEEKDFSESELNYWNQFNISKRTLDLFYVKSIKRFKLKESKFWAVSTEKEPIFMYRYSDDDKIQVVRFYRPLSKEYKHRGNVSGKDIFGLHLLHKDLKFEPLLGIVAGQKDVMSLYSNTGIKSICLNSESCYLNNDVYINLKSYTDNLFVCYDNDSTGIKYANKIIEGYPDIVRIDISKITKQKDISDYYKERIKNNISHNDVLYYEIMNNFKK